MSTVEQTLATRRAEAAELLDVSGLDALIQQMFTLGFPPSVSFEYSSVTYQVTFEYRKSRDHHFVKLLVDGAQLIRARWKVSDESLEEVSRLTPKLYYPTMVSAINSSITTAASTAQAAEDAETQTKVDLYEDAEETLSDLIAGY